MSLVAICPVASLAAHNATLEAAGFGPRNFSVPCYVGAGAQYAALHCWDNVPFADAVKALAGVVWEESDGNPVARTKALIEAQGAKWGDQSPMLPSTGNVTAGNLYQYAETDGSITMWSVIQTFNRTTYPAHPSTYPALIRRVRNPYSVEEWRQPIDQYDAYKLVNAFTGKPDECLYNNQRWKVTQADGSGNNVWQPGVFGWTQI